MIVESSGTQAATVGTEHILTAPTALKVRVLVVDVSALVGSEVVELRIKAPVLSGGVERLFRMSAFAAGESEPNTQSEPCLMAFGGTFTLKQVGGTSRSFPWRVDVLD